MFKLRNVTILCTKSAHFKFAACYRSQNSWDRAMFSMVEHLLFSKQFEDVWAPSLWVSGLLMLEFGPVLVWCRFPAAEEFLVVFNIFFCLMMHQMFSKGERSGLQAGQFSIWTLLQWSHAVVIVTVCGFALFCWNTGGFPWIFPDIDIIWWEHMLL